MHLAEKILLIQPLTFRGDYPRGSVYIVRPCGGMAVDPAEIRAIQLLRRTYEPMETMWKAGPKIVARVMVPHLLGYTCKSALIVSVHGGNNFPENRGIYQIA